MKDLKNKESIRNIKQFDNSKTNNLKDQSIHLIKDSKSIKDSCNENDCQVSLSNSVQTNENKIQLDECN